LSFAVNFVGRASCLHQS